MIKLMTSGKLSSIFITPQLRTALAAAGISWAAFTIGITYLAEAIMADMQLKAGRLGVMKAMESLEDPAYYADIEPKETVAQKVETKADEQSISKSVDSQKSNLLDKYKKM